MLLMSTMWYFKYCKYASDATNMPQMLQICLKCYKYVSNTTDITLSNTIQWKLPAIPQRIIQIRDPHLIMALNSEDHPGAFLMHILWRNNAGSSEGVAGICRERNPVPNGVSNANNLFCVVLRLVDFIFRVLISFKVMSIYASLPS